MNDLNVFVAFRGDGLSDEVRQSVDANEAGDLSKLSQRVEAGNSIFRNWAENSGGITVATMGDGGVVRVTADHLHDLHDLCDSYKKRVGATVSVGVGTKLADAQKTLEYATLMGGGCIQLYEDYVPEEVEKLKRSNAPSLLGKAEGQQDPQDDQPQMQGAAISTPEEPQEQPEVELPEEQPQPRSHVADFSQLAQMSEGREQQQQQMQMEQQQADEESENIRQEIVEVLKEFKAQGPLWEQLKQAQPKAYKTLAQMMQAMIAMGRQLYGQDEQAQGQPVQKSELLVGGAGDGIPDEEFDDDALEVGTLKEQKEHGLDARRAKEVAKDHLVEDPETYRKDEVKYIARTGEAGSPEEAAAAGTHKVIPVKNIVRKPLKPGQTGRHQDSIPVNIHTKNKTKVITREGPKRRQAQSGMTKSPIDGAMTSAKLPNQ